MLAVIRCQQPHSPELRRFVPTTWLIWIGWVAWVFPLFHCNWRVVLPSVIHTSRKRGTICVVLQCLHTPFVSFESHSILNHIKYSTMSKLCIKFYLELFFLSISNALLLLIQSVFFCAQFEIIVQLVFFFWLICKMAKKIHNKYSWNKK